MIRVYITTSDPITHRIYNEQDTIELFGDDWLIDYGTDIPDELLKRYELAYTEFWKVQDEINKYKL